MSVRQDKARKTWMAKVSYMDDLGVRRYKTKRGFKTKREAMAFEQEYKKKVSGASDMTFESFVELYLEDCSHRLKPVTMLNKRKIIYRLMVPFFGHQSMLDIDAKTVRRWQNWLMNQPTNRGEKIAQTTLRTVNANLSAIFNYALKFHGIKNNPVRVAGTIGKSTRNGEVAFWTKDQFDTFLSTVEDNIYYQLAFSLLFYSGMRIGELQALTLSDFDQEAKTVSISKTYVKINGVDMITEPKTPKSNRIITLPPSIFKLLNDYTSKLPYYKPTERLFTLGVYSYGKTLRTGADKVGLPRIRVHDLRHSHASMLIELGVSPLAISERLGHERVDTTLNIYSHLYPSRHGDIADKLEGVIRGPQEN